MQNILKQIGTNIKALRTEKGLTQDELAFKAGIHRAYMGHIERGEKNISINTLQKIALALKVNIKELL